MSPAQSGLSSTVIGRPVRSAKSSAICCTRASQAASGVATHRDVDGARPLRHRPRALHLIGEGALIEQADGSVQPLRRIAVGIGRGVPDDRRNIKGAGNDQRRSERQDQSRRNEAKYFRDAPVHRFLALPISGRSISFNT